MGGPESEVFPSTRWRTVGWTGIDSNVVFPSTATAISTHFTNEGVMEVISCLMTLTSSSQHFLPSFLMQWLAYAFLQHAGRFAGTS